MVPVILVAAILTGSSQGNDPVDAAFVDAAFAATHATPYGTSSAYLGKEADLIGEIVLRPAAAIVLLSEPCGGRRCYARARLFSYEPMRSAPTAEHDGCYSKTHPRAGTIVVYQSDGISIGRSMLQVPVAEAFAPRYFFLPLKGDPTNLATIPVKYD